MRELILHAGVHKTGTTTIQQSLWHARSLLAAHGLGYVETEANHSLALYSLFSARAAQYHFNLRRGIEGQGRLSAHNAAEAGALTRALGAPGPDRRLISAEDICKLNVAELTALRAFLDPFARRLRVILYLRPPLPWIASMAQQRLKTGRTLAAIQAHPPLPRYRPWIERLRTVFGPDAVEVRPYRRDTDPAWDALGDILQALDLGALRGRIPTAAENASMSVHAAEAIDALNRLVPVDDASGRWAEGRARGAVRFLIQLGGPRVAIPVSLTGEDRARLARQLAWVQRETGVELDPDVPAPPGQAPATDCPRAADHARLVNDLTLRWERSLRESSRLRAAPAVNAPVKFPSDRRNIHPADALPG